MGNRLQINGKTYFFGHFVPDLDALGLEELLQGLLLLTAKKVSGMFEIAASVTDRLMLLN